MKMPERLALANLPTPIVRLSNLSAETGKEIYVWRDDLTGFTESGNKIRKLEFLAAEATAQRATRLITCGGPQSNHTRATAYVARRLGMDITIVVRKPAEPADSAGPDSGNLLLNQLTGAEFVFVEYADYQAAGSVYDPFLEEAAGKSRARGEKPYVVPEGGSCALGCMGYLAAVGELLTSWPRLTGKGPYPDSLFTPLGSGGTLGGLHLGFEAYGMPTGKLFAVNVCDSEEYFQMRVGVYLDEARQAFDMKAGDNKLNIFDGHFGAGYAMASDDDLRFYIELLRKDGILLDPVYTGKAFRGMLAELDKQPDRFGQNILFLHSGGIFANFAFADQFTRVMKSDER
jgi:D-cysteine desulfhydrase